MEIWNGWNLDTGYVLLGALGLILVLLVWILILSVKQGKLNKKYKVFMGNDSGGSLERRMLDRFSKMGKLTETVEEQQELIRNLEKNVRYTYQKHAIVRYDAFSEAKGGVSFALCLLDHNNSGIILNSMYANEGCYIYVRDIKFGNCEDALSAEEEEVLQEAVQGGLVLQSDREALFREK